MADIALGSVPRIIDIALKIKEAVKNVKQNEKDCRDIERCVARVTAFIKRLDEMTAAMKDEDMHGALEDLAESLQGALELVTKCQQKHRVRRFLGAGDMAKELRLVQDDILRKVTIGSFATNVVQLTITLTIAQAGPPLHRHQQGIGTEKPSHGGHHIIGNASDGRYETDQTNKLATASWAQSIPLSGLTKFNLSELEVATQNFSEENRIGLGGFGVVFKGLLRNGLAVAVKVFHVSINTSGEFFNEINIGVKLRHKNVRTIAGYYVEDKAVSSLHDGQEVESTEPRRILVFRYLPNGSLRDMVLKGTPQRIYWPFYFRIIQGIAHGLHYIHEQNVIHLDMKPENILFDSDMNPVITDFGISTALDNGVDIMQTKACVGTIGYMPPEYVDVGRVSKKNDVFAFGSILLRTIPHAFFKVEFQGDQIKYLDFDWDSLVLEDMEKMKEFFDTTFVEESELPEVARCLKVGLLCIVSNPANRPTMAEVLDMLNGEKEVPTWPTVWPAHLVMDCIGPREEDRDGEHKGCIAPPAMSHGWP